MVIGEIRASKSRFIAKSAMTFSQFIGTAALATRLFGEFSLVWKIILVATMIALISFSIAMYPNQKNGEE